MQNKIVVDQDVRMHLLSANAYGKILCTPTRDHT